MLLLLAASAKSQNLSSFGTDFYIPFSVNVNDADLNMGIYITAKSAATGTVQVANTSIPFSVAAGGVQRIFIGPAAIASAPKTDVYLSQEDGIKTNAAIRVVSNRPVAVSAHIIFQSLSTATLVLPTSTWGLKYIAAGIQNRFFLGRPFINVMAKEANTTVDIIPKAPVFNNDRPVGQPFRITLANPGDVYQLQFARGTDPSGTIIQSVTNNTEDVCKAIGVFTGNTDTSFGCELLNPNNLYQQLFPANTWGEIFFARPMALQQFNFLRVYGHKVGTKVDFFNGTERIDKTIGAQGWVEFEIREPVQITATSPVMAVQFMPSQRCDTRNSEFCFVNNNCPFPSSPAMVVLNPITQYVDTVSVFIPLDWIPTGVNRLTRAFISIAVPDEGVANFRINGSPPVGSFTTIPGTGYSTLQENITFQTTNNPVQMLTSSVPFSCIAHGVGRIVSYAYNAGSRFVDVTQNLSVIDIAQNIRDSVCSNEEVQFQLSLPYRISRVQWLLENNLLATESPDSPAVVSLRANGDSVFTYRSGNPFRINNAGRYNIRALVNSIGGVDCLGQQEIKGVVTVFLTPVPGFSLPSFVCSGQNVSAVSQRSGASQNTQWQWLVSNGTRFTGDSINLNLTQPGSYTLQQWGESATGCNSDTVTANLVVTALPVAAFSPPVRLCSSIPFTLLDTSIGNISNRSWLVNNQPQATTGNALTLVRDSFGTISIGLRVTDDRGCQSALTTRNFTVAETPKSNFIVPGICLDDATAVFTNTTSFQSNPPASLGYVWNYGNPTAPGNTNTGNSFTGQHRYSATGNYSITLIATSPTGCSDTTVKTLTVNGSNPRASFSIANAPFCSGQPVAFINRSTVGFGNITRLVWYWNWPANPQDTTEVLSPAPGDTTRHTFALPFGAASGNFTIRLQAFSGVVCVNDTTASIRLSATPEVELDALPVLCSNAPPLQLTQGRVTNGLSGTATYAGSGISNNILNPSLTTGTDLLVNFTFTTTDGCAATTSRPIQINPAPEVNAGPDKTIIAGGNTILEGSLVSGGSNVRLRWSPDLGLNNANILQPFASPAQTTTYVLTALAADCTTSDSMVLTVQLLPIIPNAFSPNGDGINDVWLIRNLNSYADVRVKIFDRYGQTILNSIGYNIPWDGTYRSKPAPAGVYYFIIESKSGNIRQSGSVTLIR